MSRTLLVTLQITQFRNIEPVTLNLSPSLNLFIGPNAAGKTSILESLHVLARAKSFRSKTLDKLIRHNTDQFQLVAKLAGEGEVLRPVGLLRKEKSLIARIDGKPIKRLSELAVVFPLHWLGENVHKLLEDGPSARRQFLDWGLFHVEQDYIKIWKSYQKLLRQRNAALKTARIDQEVKIWDVELSAIGEKLHNFRKKYVEALLIPLSNVVKALFGENAQAKIQYRKGWKAGSSLLESLQQGRANDRERGFTQSGPQRAELQLNFDDKSAIEALSRGQQKLFVLSMYIAQAQLLRARKNILSLFLIDDLGAELDADNQRKVLALLQRIDAQVFATAISTYQKV